MFGKFKNMFGKFKNMLAVKFTTILSPSQLNKIWLFSDFCYMKTSSQAPPQTHT